MEQERRAEGRRDCLLAHRRNTASVRSGTGQSSVRRRAWSAPCESAAPSRWHKRRAGARRQRKRALATAAQRDQKERTQARNVTRSAQTPADKEKRSGSRAPRRPRARPLAALVLRFLCRYAGRGRIKHGLLRAELSVRAPRGGPGPPPGAPRARCSTRTAVRRGQKAFAEAAELCASLSTRRLAAARARPSCSAPPLGPLLAAAARPPFFLRQVTGACFPRAGLGSGVSTAARAQDRALCRLSRASLHLPPPPAVRETEPGQPLCPRKLR